MSAFDLNFQGRFQIGCHPRGLIGLGLLVLVERGGHLRAGCAGAGECVLAVGEFFWGAHATPPGFRPGAWWMPGW
nr:hypothetical protein [Streptomyces sp. CB02460]